MLDALRGAAALAVVAFHIVYFLPLQFSDTSTVVLYAQKLLVYSCSFGFSGVQLFFVISGFCIHLRWARRQEPGFLTRTNFRSFWLRRIRRLFPPYLAAAALYVMVLSISGKFNWNFWGAYDLCMHFLMLHNLDIHTTNSLNGAFWSLAVEEQLYFAYFLLLAVRIRWGWKFALAMCFTVKFIWLFVWWALHSFGGVDIVFSSSLFSNWMIWAAGAYLAEYRCGLASIPEFIKIRTFPLFSFLGAIAFDLFRRAAIGLQLEEEIWSSLAHFCWMAGFFSLMRILMAQEQKMLSSRLWGSSVRILAFVGTFSYSLYLTHGLMINHMAPWMDRNWLYNSGSNILYRFAMVPLALIVAYVFYLAIEKWTMTTQPQPHATGVKVGLQNA